MISDVCVIGRVGEIVSPNLRMVEVERVAPINGRFVVDQIPCRYWTKKDGNYFMKMLEGSYVAIKGRLEKDGEMGIIVIVEELITLQRGKLYREEKT